MSSTTYSIWDFRRKLYDYYRGPGDGATHAGPSKIRSNSEIGAIPELAAWTLPAGSVKIGSGPMPQGRIASMGGLGDLDSGDGVRVGLLMLAAYFAWKVLR